MCNLVLIFFQTAGVDMQHAVIEYNDQENVYVLKDLNTAQGTYVNECRVQNAAIRMAPGDQIKFGYMGMPYEFVVDNQPSVSYECTITYVYVLNITLFKRSITYSNKLSECYTSTCIHGCST